MSKKQFFYVKGSKSPLTQRKESYKNEAIQSYLLQPPMKLPYTITQSYYVKKKSNLSARLNYSNTNSNNSSNDSIRSIKQVYKFQLQKVKDEEVADQKRNLMKILQKISSLKQIKQTNPPILQKAKQLLTIKKQVQFPLLEQQDEDHQFQKQLKLYLEQIKEAQLANKCYSKSSSLKQELYHIEDKFPDIIKKIMSARWWWQQLLVFEEQVVFLWSQGQQFHFLSKIPNRQLQVEEEDSLLELLNTEEKQQNLKTRLNILLGNDKMHNHIQNDSVLGERKNLYKQLSKSQFKSYPNSYYVTSLVDPSLAQFLKKNKNQNLKWMVKPAELTHKGVGYKFCQSTRDVLDHIKTQLSIPNKTYRSFIIQQYIKPYLLNKRKFDIKCYVLITIINGIYKTYFYQDGFVQTSSIEYQEDSVDCLVHITNDYLQRQSELYSLFDNYNKIPFDKLENKLHISTKIIPKLRELCIEILDGMKKYIVAQDHVFQIFEFQFLLDNEFNLWLLDINSEIDLSIGIQKQMKEMIDCCFQLTLDVVHPPPQVWPREKRHKLNEFQQHNKFTIL